MLSQEKRQMQIKLEDVYNQNIAWISAYRILIHLNEGGIFNHGTINFTRDPDIT